MNSNGQSANMNAFNNFCSSLCQALRYKNLDNISKALVDEKINLNEQDPCGYIPLHFAIQFGGNASKIVKLLIDAGADPNLKDCNDGKLPLEGGPSEGLRTEQSEYGEDTARFRCRSE